MKRSRLDVLVESRGGVESALDSIDDFAECEVVDKFRGILDDLMDSMTLEIDLEEYSREVLEVAGE